MSCQFTPVAEVELAPGARGWVASNYLTLYRPCPEGIDIVRVVHGARYLG